MDRERQLLGHSSVKKNKQNSETCLSCNSLEYNTIVQGRKTRREKKFPWNIQITTSLSILIWQCRGSLSSLWLKLYLKKLKLIKHSLWEWQCLFASHYMVSESFSSFSPASGHALASTDPFLFNYLGVYFLLWNVYLYKCKLVEGGWNLKRSF